jgi:hypothetical protein
MILKYTPPNRRPPPLKRTRKAKWRTYDQSMAEIAAIHKAQSGRCANPGCRELVVPFGRGRAMDHDPVTGAAKAILCKACSVGMAVFQRKPRRLVGALIYLGYLKPELLP